MMRLLATSQSQEVSELRGGPGSSEPRATWPVLGQVVRTQQSRFAPGGQRYGREGRPRHILIREGEKGAWVPLGTNEKQKDLSLPLGSSSSWFQLLLMGVQWTGEQIWTSGPAIRFIGVLSCLPQLPRALPQIL